MTSNKYFSYLRILFIYLFFFFNKIISYKRFSVHHTMNKGGGGEIQRSQVNPRPLGKKNKKTWAIPRINFTSETDLPVWSSTFLCHEKTWNDPFITVVSSERLIIQKQANILRRCVKSLGKWILEIMIPRTYRSRAFTFRNLSYWTSLRTFHFFREVDGPIMEGKTSRLSAILNEYTIFNSLRFDQRSEPPDLERRPPLIVLFSRGSPPSWWEVQNLLRILNFSLSSWDSFSNCAQQNTL